MKPIALAVVAATLVAAAACGPKATPAKPGDGSGGPPIRAKKIQLSWGISQGATSADVFLQTTDETGASVPRALGTLPGQCTPTTPPSEMHALIALHCANGPTGLELHVIVEQADVVVLRMTVAQGVKPDPMAREEVLRFASPPGAGIEAKP